MHAPSRSLAARLGVLVLVAGCAGASPSSSPAPVATRNGGTTQPSGGAAPLIQSVWPVRTREHLDLWLHSYALINPDTTLVPYFRRGYRERIAAVRRQRAVTSLLDSNRERLVARIAIEPSLATSGQFLPLYFTSWEQMHQVIDKFLAGNGSPASAGDQQTAAYFSLLASAFPAAADRDTGTPRAKRKGAIRVRAGEPVSEARSGRVVVRLRRGRMQPAGGRGTSSSCAVSVIARECSRPRRRARRNRYRPRRVSRVVPGIHSAVRARGIRDACWHRPEACSSPIPRDCTG